VVRLEDELVGPGFLEAADARLRLGAVGLLGQRALVFGLGELPTGAVAGLGARMLSGSYYGQTIQIWSALAMAAILAAALVGAIGLAERVTYAAMGGRRA
jgi:ABC-type nitrate/sulfonate/bicarbonate transport system permease component